MNVLTEDQIAEVLAHVRRDMEVSNEDRQKYGHPDLIKQYEITRDGVLAKVAAMFANSLARNNDGFDRDRFNAAAEAVDLTVAWGSR